ncbi:MAG: hypothetical protein Kow00127_23110 [Bacteroidales bacterium]
MKGWSTNVKTGIYSIQNRLLPVLAFLLPVHDRLVTLVILLTGLLWIIEGGFVEKYRRIKNDPARRRIMFFALLWPVYAAGLLWTDAANLRGLNGGLFSLEVKLSLWVFPLLFASFDPKYLQPDTGRRIFKAFIFGSLFNAFILSNLAFYRFLNSGDSSHFFYMQLAQFHHPGYQAMFYSLAVLILLDWLTTHREAPAGKRFAVMVLATLFTLFIVLLSSKAGIIGMGLMLVIFTLFRLSRTGGNLRVTLRHCSFLLILLLAGTLIFPQVQVRFFAMEEALNQEQEAIEPQTDNGSAARMLVWKSSLEILAEHPVIGVGTGDVAPALMEKYHEHGITSAEEHGYNAHNQYLQTMLATGIAGLLVLLAGLWITLRQGWLNKEPLLFLFPLLFGFHILVESMLERQAGVVFYAFFNAFLLYHFTVGREGHQGPGQSHEDTSE